MTGGERARAGGIRARLTARCTLPQACCIMAYYAADPTTDL
jgi:hypothetical protein